MTSNLKQNDVVEIKQKEVLSLFDPEWYVPIDLAKKYNLYCEDKKSVYQISQDYIYYYSDIIANIGIILEINICNSYTRIHEKKYGLYNSYLVLVGDEKFTIPEIFLHKLS